MLAEKVNAIKSHYRVEKFAEYTPDAVIHEMAFRNHFDNGVLSYVEQDLVKIRTTFLPFEEKIVSDFGFDIDFLIEVYKSGELVSKIRFDQTTAFTHTPEFNEFHTKICNKQVVFDDTFNALPENIQNAHLSFHAKPHAYLLFSKEDLYLTLPKDKVDRFLELFSCKISSRSNFQYYTDANPIELVPIIQLSDNNYLHVCQNQMPIAVYKFLYTHFINDPAYNERIRKHRKKASKERLRRFLKTFFQPGILSFTKTILSNEIRNRIYSSFLKVMLLL